MAAGWAYSEPVTAILSPRPPVCAYAAKASQTAVSVRWDPQLDSSLLPRGLAPSPLCSAALAVEMACIRLLPPSGPAALAFEDSVRCNLASTLEANCGPLRAGMRYAFRLRCDARNATVNRPSKTRTNTPRPLIL